MSNLGNMILSIDQDNASASVFEGAYGEFTVIATDQINGERRTQQSIFSCKDDACRYAEAFIAFSDED